jgi:hypothetical protein
MMWILKVNEENSITVDTLVNQIIYNIYINW